MQAGARWDSIKYPPGPPRRHVAPLVRVCLQLHKLRTCMDKVQSTPHCPHVQEGAGRLLVGAHLRTETLLPCSRDQRPDAHRCPAHLLCRQGDGVGPGAHLRGSVSEALSHSPLCASWPSPRCGTWRGGDLCCTPHQCPKLLCRSRGTGLPGSPGSHQLPEVVLGRVENCAQHRVPASCRV